MAQGLHEAIRKKATNGTLRISDLKPNSRDIAQRLIAEGKLVKSGLGYVWHESKK